MLLQAVGGILFVVIIGVIVLSVLHDSTCANREADRVSRRHGWK